MSDRPVVVYGTKWCCDCNAAKRVLNARGVPYDWMDVEADAEARRLMLGLNGGMHSVPTVVFPDGTVLVEPSAPELTARLDELRP